MNRYVFIPNDQQTLLLRAALWKEEAALSAWREWKENNVLESIDRGSLRLLPLLYRNLESLGVSDPFMEQLKEVYHHTRDKNNMLFHACADVLRSFQKAGIPTVLLKGPAMVLRYYADPGVRPMADFDVLIPEDSAAAAINHLEKLAWRLSCQKAQSIPDLISVRSGFSFTDPSGLNLDLHWRAPF